MSISNSMSISNNIFIGPSICISISNGIVIRISISIRVRSDIVISSSISISGLEADCPYLISCIVFNISY